ncbi:hypothetical protein GO594_23215 [Pseudomonas otitidis]|uniref:Uncharacterized protein n=1 Tax=Metapseudomonas otitidis TaxID=319939 RepID=A0A7X3HD96_9GAMM|nr:hypothetical protein [Pseudomonas otitidis]MWK58904.1 hypothetical protein [Pseudomonas otitidis]
MPMPPLPRTFICPKCGWQRTTTPASDALRLNIDWFYCCPVCQHTELEARPASRTEIMRARLIQLFRNTRF